MYFLVYIISIAICLASCDCQKLICDGTVINSYENFDHVIVSYMNSNSKSFNFTNLREFDPSRKTVFIIHGFLFFEWTYDWAFDMGKKWLEREPVNVIIVHWSMSVAAGGIYRMTSLSTEHVALEISEKILNLLDRHGTRLNPNFHFVGHSLGAHISGQTARLLKSNGILVRRVTALDPAYPCFENESASLRLHKSDAQFVDVYHTNSEPGKNKGNLGIYDMIGHVDFYVNGGNMQPECERKCSAPSSWWKDFDCLVKSISLIHDYVPKTVSGYVFGLNTEDIAFKGYKESSYCQHNAAYRYFTESLDRDGEKKWAVLVEWPVEVTKSMRCQNRNCKYNNSFCIEMGINYEFNTIDSLKYHVIGEENDKEEPSKAFYIDTSDAPLDCDC